MYFKPELHTNTEELQKDANQIGQIFDCTRFDVGIVGHEMGTLSW